MSRMQLNSPCLHCPFRKDISAYLTPERAQEIADSLRSGAEFPCHKTVDYSKDSEGVTTSESKFCAGSMVVLEKSEGPNQMMRIAERLGLYDYRNLNTEAPVFESLEEFIEAQEAS